MKKWIAFFSAGLLLFCACQSPMTPALRSETELEEIAAGIYPPPQSNSEKAASNSLVWGMAFPPLDTEIPRGYDQRPLDFTLETLNDLKLKHLRFAEDWKQRETDINDFDWAPLDTRMEALKDFKLLMTIQSNGPEWRCSNHNERACVFNDLNAFESYLGQLLQRYPEQIHMIQFGNEMLKPDFYPGQASDFLRSHQRFVEVVRRLAPELPVVLGGFASETLRRFAFCEGRLDFVFYHQGKAVKAADRDSFCLQNWVQDENFGLRQLLQNAEYDVIDFHFYDDPEYWPQIYAYLLEELHTRSKLKEETSLPRIIVSEFGGPALPLEPDDEAYQAHRLQKYMTTLKALPGLEAAYFFKLFPDSLAQSIHRNSTLFHVGLPPRQKAAYKIFKDKSTAQTQ